MEKKILLTGGAGYIGSHTAVELLNDGWDVVIADNFSNSCPAVLERIEELTGKKPAFYEVDVCNEEALTKLFEAENIDAVVYSEHDIYGLNNPPTDIPFL